MNDGIIYKQGTVVLLPFPYSDLSSSQKRPAVIISNELFNRNSSDLICCLITTNLTKDNLSVFITEKDVVEGNIHFNSKIKPYRVFTVSKRIVLKKLCVLKKEKINSTIFKLNKIISKIN